MAGGKNKIGYLQTEFLLHKLREKVEEKRSAEINAWQGYATKSWKSSKTAEAQTKRVQFTAEMLSQYYILSSPYRQIETLQKNPLAKFEPANMLFCS